MLETRMTRIVFVHLFPKIQTVAGAYLGRNGYGKVVPAVYGVYGRPVVPVNFVDGADKCAGGGSGDDYFVAEAQCPGFHLEFGHAETGEVARGTCGIHFLRVADDP